MKAKLFLIVALLISGVAQAQFEGAICEPSFVKFSNNTVEESIVGKTISCVEYSPGTWIDHDYEITTGQALKLALTLIRDPKDLGLLRNHINLIVTPEGVINIYFYKGVWRLLFLDTKNNRKINTTKGARVFVLD